MVVTCLDVCIIYFISCDCEFKSRRGKNNNLTALKSNSNTVWFNFQTYIYIYIYIYLTIVSSKWQLYNGCTPLESVLYEFLVYRHN